MIRISNIKMRVNHNLEDIKQYLYNYFNINEINIKTFKISGKSIDARSKHNIYCVYSVDLVLDNEEKYIEMKNVKKIEKYEYKIDKLNYIGNRPVVVGSGPAGLFASLILSEAGLKPIIIERGKNVDERMEDVYEFFNSGILNENSNVQYGEGGAGTFSDGKLTTNVNNDKINKVIEELILAGAPEEIEYLSKPHIGTDKLIEVLKKIRIKIESLGGEYRFNQQFVDFIVKNEKLKSVKIKLLNDEDIKNNNYEETYEISTEILILALGHSSRDTVEMLHKNNIYMEVKPFSVGVRIEHKQKMIDEIQYGKFASKLPPAEYKINVKTTDGRGVYTFCMCPGGVVVPSSSEKNRLVVNGMSYYKRDLENANSAVLVNVYPEDFEGNNPLAGIEFQRKLEEKAYELGGGDYIAPVQLVGDFLNGNKSIKIGSVKPSYSIGYKLSDLSECLPKFIVDSLKEGLVLLNRKLNGFIKDDSILTAVESRSSSPVKIVRNDKMYSNVLGIIPCGEGAGYAGGIMSAAVDGIKCAEIAYDYYKSLI